MAESSLLVTVRYYQCPVTAYLVAKSPLVTAPFSSLAVTGCPTLLLLSRPINVTGIITRHQIRQSHSSSSSVPQSVDRDGSIWNGLLYKKKSLPSIQFITQLYTPIYNTTNCSSFLFSFLLVSIYFLLYLIIVFIILLIVQHCAPITLFYALYLYDI